MKIDDQLHICSRIEWSPAHADPEEIRATIETIERWVTHQRAASTAGVSASSARDRREIAARIDSLIESAPPHLRNSRIPLAVRARSAVTAPQCSGVEKELRALLHADLAADEWLAAIAAIDTRQAPSEKPDAPTGIHAVLLLKQRQSRSPRDPESP
ncbi:MAG TPA: hypothetical protein VJ865_10510 [Gemmatimonadaceae bacterium]|nr:hypothetical protein [Gemmatimonadaceae bacterium]